jgi:protein gp37
VAETKIEWTATVLPDGTTLPGFSFNPWVGCQAVSDACAHCYAEATVKRFGGDFAVRRRTTPSNWRQPLKWNDAARAAGVRRKVFCASMADVFDNQVPDEWRMDLWAMIAGTPQLDWLVLTKRPQNIAKMMAQRWPRRWDNLWLGTTVENQTEADRRIPHLLAAPAAVHFLSCEPLLSAVDLSRWLRYNPLHEKQAERRICLPSGAEWRFGDQTGRNDLETAQEGMGPLETAGSQPTVQGGPPSRTSGGEGRRISSGLSDDGSSEGLRFSAPSCVSSLQGTDPTASYRQPQERAQSGQCSEQSGIGDIFGTATSRNPRPEGRACLQSGRREEQYGFTFDGAGSGDQTSSAERRAANSDSERLRSGLSDGIENSSWRPPIQLVIVGGESGPRRRPMDLAWARSIRDQCASAGVAFFGKQYDKIKPLPADLMVRQFPESRA